MSLFPRSKKRLVIKKWFREKDNGTYVLYTDHLAAVMELVRLCLSNGIISRGDACRYLACAREDLDDLMKEDSDGVRDIAT